MRSKIVVAICSLVIGVDAWGASLDASSLMKPHVEPEKKAKTLDEQAPKALSQRQVKRMAGRVSNEEDGSLRAAIKSYGVVLQKTPEGPARNKMLLGRASAYLSLAQLRLLTSDNFDPDAESASLLERCAADIDATLKSRYLTYKLRAKALSLIGLAQVYLNRYDRGAAFFLESLKLDPRSHDAGWMGFFLAEQYFEKEKFKEAIHSYTRAYTMLKPDAKRMAYYKIAWSYLNLQRFDAAEKAFLVLVNSKTRDDMSRDATRDLAFLLAKSKNEDQILVLMDTNRFKDPKVQLEILRAIHLNREMQGYPSYGSRILARLYHIEKDPIKRLELRINALATVRKEHASINHYKAFDEVMTQIQIDGIDLGVKEAESAASKVDAEAQTLMRVFVETFAGRIKTPDALTRPEIAERLTKLFAFYWTRFPAAKPRIGVITLWMDVCADTKDWVCVESVARTILAEKSATTLHSRATLERLIALEELAKVDPPKYEATLGSVLDEFVAQNESSPQWESAAKRLADLSLKTKPEKANALNEKLFVKKPSAENYYRLQWARFQSEKFEEVLAEKREDLVRGPKDKRVPDLVRESALKLAVKAKASGDIGLYANLVQTFLAKSQDPRKAAMVRKDLFQYLLEKEDYQTATEEMLKIRQPERFAESYRNSLYQLAYHHFRAGRFYDVQKLVVPVPPAALGEFGFLVFLTDLGLERRPDVKTVTIQPTEKREYLLALTALFQPTTLIAWLKKDGSLARNDNEQAAALVALRLAKKRWDFNPTPAEFKWVSNVIGETRKLPEKTSTERKIEKLVFPRIPSMWGPKGEKRYTEELQKVMVDMRKIREGLRSDLQGKPALVQVTLLNMAAGAEENVAVAIMGSRIPPNLKTEQIAEYRAALEGVAKEFIDQAVEVRKLETAAAAVVEQEAQSREAARAPSPHAVHDWDWGSAVESKKGEALKTLIMQKRFAGALVVADVERGDLLKSVEDYYPIRSGALLGVSPTEVMAEYVAGELRQAGQNSILERWKKGDE